ncbi:hypothetical protein CAPTEDRAFT_212520 [Capitella teleta]|uniref:Tyrosinase copper-binding domain-containing protein n=1 Tax=Capitella teleta TaxID=283909 RepID=R7UB97_CAPTE|nr:hypothetical protein CAPTEDRAFT_212520 [Capitella teleta]|eukprot:ELU00527.1 hypothetical protein CAPTEDRAFT_212520 [Capitella teleta]
MTFAAIHHQITACSYTTSYQIRKKHQPATMVRNAVLLFVFLIIAETNFCKATGLLESVHGPDKRMIARRRMQSRSPNLYYLLYKNIAAGISDDVILKHPALPVESDKDGDDCGIGNQRGINPNTRRMMCEMYQQWTESSESDNWEPTAAQREWWRSLGRTDPPTRWDERATRKEYRTLSDNERRRFHGAVNNLKESFVDNQSKYDLFVRHHQARQAPGAYFGPGFYGWHREMLFRFENAIREMDPLVSLPYWDSNLDFNLGDDLATQSILWTPDFFGNGQGEVNTCPFAHWTTPTQTGENTPIHRNLNAASSYASLMSNRAISAILKAPSFREITWFVDAEFQSHSLAVHKWIGGSMRHLHLSPADPIFFLHYAFVDCLWDQFRTQQQQSGVDVRYDYPNDTLSLGLGPRRINDGASEHSAHFSLNLMYPFDPLRNIDGLRGDYFHQFYSCAVSPVCSKSKPNCGSKYLFCDVLAERCTPKLQIGAPCMRFMKYRVCHEGVCCNGRCQSGCENDHRGRSGLSSSSEEHATFASRPKNLDIGSVGISWFNFINETKNEVDTHRSEPDRRVVTHEMNRFPLRNTPSQSASVEIDTSVNHFSPNVEVTNYNSARHSKNRVFTNNLQIPPNYNRPTLSGLHIQALRNSARPTFDKRRPPFHMNHNLQSDKRNGHVVGPYLQDRRRFREKGTGHHPFHPGFFNRPILPWRAWRPIP